MEHGLNIDRCFSAGLMKQNPVIHKQTKLMWGGGGLIPDYYVSSKLEKGARRQSSLLELQYVVCGCCWSVQGPSGSQAGNDSRRQLELCP